MTTTAETPSVVVRRPGREACGQAGWVLVGASFLGRVYLAMAAGLLLWATVPIALGWSSLVILTGSMTPVIEPGDAVLVDRVAPTRLEPGMVLVVDDPAHIGRTISHRLQEVREDGTLILKGDANGSADSTPVSPDQVRGVARLLVPVVGLPKAWSFSHNYTAITVWAVGSLLAVAAVTAESSRRTPVDRRAVPAEASARDAVDLRPSPEPVPARPARGRAGSVCRPGPGTAPRPVRGAGRTCSTAAASTRTPAWS